jgi:hypothetical protein
MSLLGLRARLPLVVFILVAVLCLALLGFACACLTDHPMQAVERVLTAIAAVPAVVDVWAAAVVAFLAAAAAVATRRVVAEAPSHAALQRFLL